MRTDIQTLRALAVVLVLLWHAGVPGFPGGYVGVDVFFVVSGFLMTQIILTEFEERGRFDLPRFYLRRARRLFPAAAVAVLGTVAITLTLLPSTRWPSISGDIVASATYLVNWRLAERSVDYLSSGAAPSPLQHFWSLAVEEQFYVVWPVLLAGVLLVSHSHRRSRGGHAPNRVPALALTVVIVLASLGWSIWLTDTEPSRAFFVTTTRVWELALGGLVASAWGVWVARPPRPGVSGALVVLGLVSILAAAVSFDRATAFPGSAALVPTLGTAAILLGGPFVQPTGLTGRVLAAGPAQWIGGLSYSLYLWHWPMLVGAAAVLGRTEPTWPVGLVVVAASLLPAWLSLRFVERPFRGALPLAGQRVTSRRLGRWVIGYALTAAACAAALALAPLALGQGRAGQISPSGPIRPSPADALNDVYTPFYDDGCAAMDEGALATLCLGGDPDGAQTIVLMGDSHAVMWMPAFDAAGAEHGWRVELIARTTCPAADVTPMSGMSPRESCPVWVREVTEHLQQQAPDVVVTAQVPIPRLWIDEQIVPSVAGRDDFAAGLVRTWEDLRATGTAVVSMAPTPRFDTDRPECVVQNLDDLDTCSEPLEQSLAVTRAPVEMALSEAPWVHTLDLNAALCPDGTCPAVQDGVLVWTDTNHLSRTRSLQLSDPLADQLAAVLDGER